jgi:phosphoribosylformylglycinamidine synthase subunit PurS
MHPTLAPPATPRQMIRVGRTRSSGTLQAVVKVVVDVMPKPEILDPQGQAVAKALPRLGFQGVSDVRQGKHFELEVDESVDDDTLAKIAEGFLSNPVIEDVVVRRVDT